MKVMFMDLKAIRVLLRVETDDLLTDFTGRLTKTLAMVACKEATLFHGMRGILSPFHVSPIMSLGKKPWEVGNAVTPYYEWDKESKEWKLIPVKFNNEEHMVHVGGVSALVDCIERGLDKLKPQIALRFNNTVVRFKIEDVEDATNDILGKELNKNKVTIYFKGPSKFFNPYIPTKLPLLFPKALDVLIGPYLALRGSTTVSPSDILEAMRILGLLIEAHYSIRNIEPRVVPFKNKKEVGIVGKVTYIVDTNKPEMLKRIEMVLNAAEIYGVGESRANGFGTIIWMAK